MSWREPSESEIWDVQAPECQLTSNGCALATEKEMKQGFDYTTAQLTECNVEHEYSAVEKRQDNIDGIEVTWIILYGTG